MVYTVCMHFKNKAILSQITFQSNLKLSLNQKYLRTTVFKNKKIFSYLGSMFPGLEEELPNIK